MSEIPFSPLQPTTTIQEDLTVAGQRRVNLIWETTQAIIAVLVVLSVIMASLFNVFTRTAVEIPAVLSNAAFLIIGFYFSRTNHSAIGGIGRKRYEQQEYLGR